MKNTLAVIIPTYNASSTITKLISQILTIVPYAYVFVVDDNSPDQTATLVKKTFNKNKNVVVLHRNSKNGRGSAVIHGFKEALKDKNIEYFVEMDSDLVHNPVYIPRMIEKCQTYDIVLASRYIKGSKLIGWKLKRRVFSKIANTILKLFLKIPISDYSNGFRCYKRKVIEQTDFSKIQAKGFIVLSEIAYLMYEKGFIFGEIPFVFKSFDTGKSNMSRYEIKEALETIVRLKNV